MPVHWTISHPARLVIAVAKDEVKVEDIEQYFTGITVEGAMAYRKIFEIGATPMAMTEEGLKSLGQRVMLYAQHGQVGPVWSRARTKASPRRRPSPPRPTPNGRCKSSARCMPRAAGSTSRTRPRAS